MPAGLAFGLPIPLVWVLTVAGSFLSVTAVNFAGDALQCRLVGERGDPFASSHARLYRVWTRYGIPGWGFVSPLVFAPPMGSALALALGAPRDRLWAWTSAGVIVWSSLLVVAGALGVGLLHHLA